MVEHESADFEYALAYTGIENLTIKAILADYGTNSTGPFDGKSTWASYQFEIASYEIANADSNALMTNWMVPS